MALTDNLNAYWKMNETSDGSGAVTRVDSTANGNDLTDNNTTASGTGHLSNGADLERSNSESLSRADNASLSITGSESVSMWVKPEGTLESVFVSKAVGSGNRGFQWLLASATSIEAVVSSTGSNESGGSFTISSISTVAFTHLVLVYDATAGTMDLYVNGTAHGTPLTGLVNSQHDNANAFYVGSTAGTSRFFDGIIDEVGVWSRALTEEEVEELYNSGDGLTYPFTASGPANLKSYNTNLTANVKTINTNAIANVKSLNTNV